MAAPQHFSIVVLDVEASGSLSGPEKEKIRADLYAILDGALEQSGITEEQVHAEDRGDGVFLLVTADVSKRRLLDPLIRVLDDALRARTVGEPWLRLRLVVDHGEAILDEHGSSGPALDEAFAMVDADELRAALKEARQGRMAVVVPDDLYRSVVRGYAQPNPDAFRMRRLETKRGRIRTWVTVTGAVEQPGSGRRLPDVPTYPTGGPVMKVHTGDSLTVKNNSGFVGTNESGTVNFGVPPQGRGER
jgi:hypothetical protein